jgi:hypothetical protein
MGYRQLIARSHRKSIRVIGRQTRRLRTPAFGQLVAAFYTPDREAVRQRLTTGFAAAVNLMAVVDLDAVLREPGHPTQLLPAYDSGDHLHPNDTGCIAEANAITPCAVRKMMVHRTCL